MAGAAGKIAKESLDFIKGMNKTLRPNSVNKALSQLSGEEMKAAQKVLSSNSAKNGMKTAEAMLKGTPVTGIANTIHHMDGGKGFKESMKLAHSKHVFDVNGKQVFEKNGMAKTRISKSKVAGTVATVGVTGRVVTGGGLYRDRYGNINVPGVPFI